LIVRTQTHVQFSHDESQGGYQMNRTILRMALIALLVISAQATGTLAGTTGALTGYVVAQSGAPVASAKVTASAASQTATTDTDTRGHFAFVSLSPDTYTLTASKDGYETVSQAGITVIADNTRTITITLQPTVKTIGVVTTRAAAELVKPGTTADVYSVNAATTAKVASLGGGGSLNQAYAALAATPGVAVYPGQNGWFQAIYIRGGDYDQVGYEFDGVPVLRSYDNYPATTANTLGQQELQIYTGAAPADAQGQGLAGYINQVVKSGTYPGFSTVTMGIGTPTLYNGYNFEVGGATPDRNFSYYLASTDSTQDFRYGDQNNGASLQSQWGAPFAPLPCPGNATDKNYASCYASGIGPGGYLLSSPVNTVLAANSYDRENVINLHFGIPHSNDSGKDDIQLVYDTSYLNDRYYGSSSDWGFSNPLYANTYAADEGIPVGPGYPYLAGNLGLGIQYLGQVGAPLSPNYHTLTNPVYFAYNPNSIGSGFLYIPNDQRDGTANPNSIVKLQFQHNFGSTAYFRIYGFSDYSEWPQTCPITLDTFYVGYCPLNYYVSTNTNGATATYGNQINDKNLLTVDLSDYLAVDYRANDDTMINQLEGLDNYAYVVNANNPTAGICYNTAGKSVSCYSANAEAYTLANSLANVPPTALPASCGGGPCEYWVAENGQLGGANYNKPNFGNMAITDQFKPSSQWFFNFGLREDRMSYAESNTDANPARNFWFNAWNNSYCVLPGGGQVPFYNTAGDTGGGAGAACPAGTNFATLTNLPNYVQNYYVFQPRLGATFTANQDNVFRLSAGKYDQAPNTAFEQYNVLQQDLPAYDGSNFWAYGFNTTSHAIYPPTSDNYDLSWEHHFAGTEASFKLTPYYRTTHNQIQNFYLNQKTVFVSGLNAGNQTADGVEFQLNLGNFNENGLSALLAYTYTHAYINFSTLQNGGTVLDSINVSVQQYNSFTKACSGVAANSSTTSTCGQFGGANAFPCYNPGLPAGSNGVALGSCTAADVANPYWNAPAQAALNPYANYIPFSTIPGGIEAVSNSYEVPSTAALILNFKHDKWAISPQFQFLQGSYYGDPLSGYGVNPETCATLNATGSVAGDPRYGYGAAGGSPYDATTCGATGVAPISEAGLGIAVPDPYTKTFDGIGAFRQPNQFLMHAQLSYLASPRVSFTVNVANIINSCFGGSVEPWTLDAPKGSCGGGTSGNGAGGYNQPGYNAPLRYGANIYNPGSSFQPIVEFPYQPNPLISPLEAVFAVKVSM
jgi:Carboxypeptidase regulatory-like domain/TonB-dependent Receptor Plug Domain